MKKVFNKIGSYTRFFDEFSSSLLLQRNTIVSIVSLFLFFLPHFRNNFVRGNRLEKYLGLYYTIAYTTPRCTHITILHKTFLPYNHYNRYQRLNTPGKFERDK